MIEPGTRYINRQEGCSDEKHLIMQLGVIWEILNTTTDSVGYDREDMASLMNAICNISKEKKELLSKPKESKPSQKKSDIDELGFSAALMNRLVSEGINSIHHLINMTEMDLLKKPGLGKNSILVIKDALSLRGLRLAQRFQP